MNELEENSIEKSVEEEIKNEKEPEKINEDQIKATTLEIINDQFQKISTSFDYDFKIVTLGNPNTGKTCLLSRYFKNIFEKHSPTITVDFFTKSFKMDGKNVLLTAYDTAGSENYMSITSKYVRDKHCVLFVYDLTDRNTFEDMNKWK